MSKIKRCKIHSWEYIGLAYTGVGWIDELCKIYQCTMCSICKKEIISFEKEKILDNETT